MTLSHCAKPRWKLPHWKPPHLWLLYHMPIKTGCLDFSKWLLKCSSNRSRDCTFITEKPSSQQPTNERTPGNKPVTIWLETSLKRNVLLQGAQGFDCTTAVRTWGQSREDLDSSSRRHPRSLTHTHTAQTGHGLPAVGNSFYHMCESDKCLCGLGVTAK